MKRTRPTTATVVAVVVALLFVSPSLAQIPDPPSLPPSVKASVDFQPLATVYQEDFEAGTGGFTAIGNTTWEHGIPDDPPLPATGQGPHMWGTNLEGDYEHRECGFLESPPIELGPAGAGVDTDVTAARLSFDHWLDVDQYDGAAVFASTDGEEWDLIVPRSGYEGIAYNSVRECFGLELFDPVWDNTDPRYPSQEWRTEEFDLTPYLGQEVQLRWGFASSALGPERGWYVDDVAVHLGAGLDTEIPIPEPPSPSQEYTPLATIYQEDFESSDGDWQADDSGAWDWGAIQAPPQPQPGSLSGWATNTAGDHDGPACGSLTSPSIEIPGARVEGAETARFSFDLWRHTEQYRDGAILQATPDQGENWYPLEPIDGYDSFLHFATQEVADCLLPATTGYAWTGPSQQPAADDWKRVEVDVSAFMGQDVQFRFLFAADAYTGHRGVYVNDVALTIGAGTHEQEWPPSAPAVPAPGWEIGGHNPSWEYGRIFDGPSSVTPAWGTNLFGDYNAFECSTITSPPIATPAIPGLGRLTLSFEHHMSTYFRQAGGAVQVSNDDGASWNTLTPVGGYHHSLFGGVASCLNSSQGFTGGYTGDGFEERDVRLTGFDGDVIRVRFVFGATSQTDQDLGWYIRGVNVHRDLIGIPITPSSPHLPLGGVDTPGTGAFGVPPGGPGSLEAKADKGLQDRIRQDPDGTFSAIVTGPAHTGLREDAFADRAAARAALAKNAAGFIGSVETLTMGLGGDVVASWNSVPAVKIEGPGSLLAGLADLEEVTAIYHDDGDRMRVREGGSSVGLIEPIEGDELGAQNTEGRNQLQAEAMWALGYRGDGVTISIIDTGIDARHEAFKNADGSSRIAAFADCQSGGCTEVDPYDDHGHGTHVAGSAAGSDVYDDPEHGTFEETGVAPNATILGAKFLNSGGSGSLEGAIDALEWSFDQGADITSNSWGSSCSSGASPVLESIRTLTDLGMLSVAAAGNSGPSSGTIGSPGCSESAVGVGAVDDDENIASFSSRGPCRDPEVDGELRICPDVVAKGKDVRSAIPRDGASNAAASGYRTWSGTSMATPHVAGALALAEQIKQETTGTPWNTSARAELTLLEMTSKDLGENGPDDTYGHGIVQLLDIYALLNGSDGADVIADFGVSNLELYHGDATRMHFNVHNIGGTAASGDYRVNLTAPDGTTEVLADLDLTLGLLEGHSLSETFTVTSDTPMGTYTFDASYAYSWTDPTTGETMEKTLDFSEEFLVYRVDLGLAIDGLEDHSPPILGQDATVRVENFGNAPGNDVVFEFTVPDRYQFLPGDAWTPLEPDSLYADPAPDAVHEDADHDRVTLVYDLDTMDVGEAFTITTRLAGTTPGEYRSVASARFGDDGGNSFINGTSHTQNIGLGVPQNAPAVKPEGTDEHTMAMLMEKADPSLIEALENGPGAPVSVIVTGAPHEGLDRAEFADRASAMAELDRRAAPFMDTVTETTRAMGADVVARWSAVPAVKIEAPLELLLRLAGERDVRHMALDHDEAVQLVQPMEGDEAGTQNSEGRNQLQAEEMWALGFQGDDIRVSIIDTGIDAGHEAFKNADGSSRIAAFAECLSDDCQEVDPYDDHGHGTHVAGSAAGSDVYIDPEHGKFEETGVAPNATILGAKFLNSGGSGSLQGGIDALNWSFNQDADITSNSWGSSCGSNTVPVNAAVRTFTDLGMVSVFAAGNSGPSAYTILGPACSESAISVGAVDGNENIASFSSRGPCQDPETGGDYRICPDVVAKGKSVRSAIPRDDASFADPTGYKTWDGTSMATPHVAGALVLSEQMKRHYTDEGWDTPDRAEKLLLEMTSKDLGETGADDVYGHGLPQLANIHAFLDETDEAVVVPSFGISRTELYLNEETRMHFGVMNLGSVVADGAFRTSLTQPDGTTQVLTEENVALGALEGHDFVETFEVDWDTLLGTYTFDASYDYTWTNQSTGEVMHEEILRSGEFHVYRPVLEVAIDGLENESLPVLSQEATVVVENTGNAPGQQVRFEFTVPDRYEFLPGDNWDPLDPDTRYADPAPDRVEENPDFGRVTLVYDLDELDAGQRFSFTTNLAGTIPGEYRSAAVANFHDAGGNAFSMSDTHTQQVGAGLP